MVAKERVKPEMRARIGKEEPAVIAVDEVCKSEIRRYVIGTLDDNPLWYDETYAKKSNFGAGCAPGVYVLSAISDHHQPLGKPDFARKLKADEDARSEIRNRPGEKTEPDWPEGVGVFHAGDDVECRQLPRIGDRIHETLKIVKIEEKTGRSGKLAIVHMDGIYTNQRGDILCINHGTLIAREMSGPAYLSPASRGRS
jgi:acyl dehydratase